MLACATAPQFDDNWPVERYFRKAQEQSDRGRYNVALQYYDQIYARFGNRIDKIAAAEYEQGFIYFKTKQYAKAKELFETAIVRFTDPLTARYFGPSDQWILDQSTKLLERTNAILNAAEEKRQADERKKAEREAQKKNASEGV